MRACGLGEPGPSHLLVNGHDFERWIVQRACAVLYSGNADYRGLKVDLGSAAPPVLRAALLDGLWPTGGGLYFGPPPDQGGFDGAGMSAIYGVHDAAALLPQTVIGFRVTLTGVPFAVRWVADDMIAPSVAAMFYSHRPEGVRLLGPTHQLDLRFTWDPVVRPGPMAQYGPLTMAELDELWAGVGGRPAPRDPGRGP